jgi:hypothetical protein
MKAERRLHRSFRAGKKTWKGVEPVFEPFLNLRAYTGEPVLVILTQFLTLHLERARALLLHHWTGVLKKGHFEDWRLVWKTWTRAQQVQALLDGHVDWLTVPRTILDQVIQDLHKTTQKAIADRSGTSEDESGGKAKKTGRKAG